MKRIVSLSNLKIKYQLYRYVNHTAGIKSRQPQKLYAITSEERVINMQLQNPEQLSGTAMKRVRITILLSSHRLKQ